MTTRRQDSDTPFFDRKCPACGTVKLDSLEPCEPPAILCADCGEPTERAWLTTPSNVIGDEMEHTQVNGLKQPRRFTSKIEHRRWLKANGYRVFDTHVGEQGSDKNKFTSSVNGIDAQTLENARQLVSRQSQAGRRDEKKTEIGITSFEGLISYLTTQRKASAGAYF